MRGQLYRKLSYELNRKEEICVILLKTYTEALFYIVHLN